MYDVLYLDRVQGETILAKGLAREAACDMARTEARRRQVGRMFAAGSELGRSDVVLIVESAKRTA